MIKLFWSRRRRRREAEDPSVEPGEATSGSESSEDESSFPGVLHIVPRDDVSSMHDTGTAQQEESTTIQNIVGLNKLLAMIPGEDSVTGRQSRNIHSTSTKYQDKQHPTSSAKSITSDTNESDATVPTRNVATTGGGLLSSFVFLSLLPTHRVKGSSKKSFSSEVDDVGLNDRRITPRDVVVSSLQAHIGLYTPDVDASEAWMKRETLPVRVDDAALIVRKDDASLAKVDKVVMGCLVRHEYDRALEMYETLRKTIQFRVPQSEVIRPLLSRLAVLSLLAGRERRARAYCRKLVECSDTKSEEVLEALILTGLLRFGAGRLREAHISWREASYKVANNNREKASLLWNNFACLQIQVGALQDAQDSLQQSLALQKHLLNEAGDINQVILNTAVTLSNLSVVNELDNNFGAASARLEESLILYESVLKDNHKVICLTKTHLARLSGRASATEEHLENCNLSRSNTLWNQGFFDESCGIPLPRATPEVGGTADFIQLGPLEDEYSPNERVHESFIHSSVMLKQQANDRARPNPERSSIPIDVDGGQVIDGEMNLADIYRAVTDLLVENEISDALDLMKCCLRSHSKAYGMVHPLVASTLHNIGVVLLFAGRFDDAFTYFQQAISIRTSTFGTDRAEASASMMKFGLLQLSKRQFQSALQTFTNALHILRKVHGYYHPLTIKVLNNIACAHFECGGLVAATKAVEEAIEILRRTSTANNDASLALSILLSNQGFLLSKRGLNTEASEAYREAANIQKDLLAHDDSSLVMTKENLGITEARAESNQHRKPRRLPVSCNLTYEDYECAI